MIKLLNVFAAGFVAPLIFINITRQEIFGTFLFTFLCLYNLYVGINGIKKLLKENK